MSRSNRGRASNPQSEEIIFTLFRLLVEIERDKDDLRHSYACFLRKILIGSDVFLSHYYFIYFT